jgi:hypothetical protein
MIPMGRGLVLLSWIMLRCEEGNASPIHIIVLYYV